MGAEERRIQKSGERSVPVFNQQALEGRIRELLAETQGLPDAEFRDAHLEFIEDDALKGLVGDARVDAYRRICAAYNALGGEDPRLASIYAVID